MGSAASSHRHCCHHHDLHSLPGHSRSKTTSLRLVAPAPAVSVPAGSLLLCPRWRGLLTGPASNTVWNLWLHQLACSPFRDCGLCRPSSSPCPCQRCLPPSLPPRPCTAMVTKNNQESKTPTAATPHQSPPSPFSPPPSPLASFSPPHWAHSPLAVPLKQGLSPLPIPPNNCPPALVYVHVCVCVYMYVCIFVSACVYIYIYIATPLRPSYDDFERDASGP